MRNITDLGLVLCNKTRWSGKHEMLLRFIRIRDQIIEASYDVDCTINIDRTISFLRQVEKYSKMFSEMNTVTKSLQTRVRTLSDSFTDIDVLLEAIDSDKTDPYATSYKYSFKPHHVGMYNTFESVVIQIQMEKPKN